MGDEGQSPACVSPGPGLAVRSYRSASGDDALTDGVCGSERASGSMVVWPIHDPKWEYSGMTKPWFRGRGGAAPKGITVEVERGS
jgi:hypothetical protein